MKNCYNCQTFKHIHVLYGHNKILYFNSSTVEVIILHYIGIMEHVVKTSCHSIKILTDSIWPPLEHLQWGCKIWCKLVSPKLLLHPHLHLGESKSKFCSRGRSKFSFCLLRMYIQQFFFFGRKMQFVFPLHLSIGEVFGHFGDLISFTPVLEILLRHTWKTYINSRFVYFQVI